MTLPSVRLGVIDPKPDSASSYYRSWGVFPDLVQAGDGSIDIVNLPNINWNTLQNIDAVFVRSPVGNHSIPLIKSLQSQGFPVWMDFDDSIDLMPNTFPLYQKLGDQSRIMADLWDMADALSTSSIVLYERWKAMGYACKSYHISNTIGMSDIVRWAKVSPPKKPCTVKRLWWRGGQSHYENVVEYLDSLKGVDKDCQVVFQGYDFFNPIENTVEEVHPSRKPVANPFTNYQYIPWKPIPFCFLESMRAQPDIQIVMHNKHVFNESKSCSAWIEGILAGAVSVVPNTPEWVDLPGVLFYTPGDKKGFRQAVDEALQLSPNDIQLRLRNGLDYIYDKFNLRKLNCQRISLIKKLLNIEEDIKIG